MLVCAKQHRASRVFRQWNFTDLPLMASCSLLCRCLQVTSLLPNGAVFNFSDVLPADKSYVTYSGPLTTPACTGQPQLHPVPAMHEVVHSAQSPGGVSCRCSHLCI
jgi:hypothetical protein